MISWHKVGQKVQCIFSGRWMFKRRSLFRKRWSDGPGAGVVETVIDVVSRGDEIWFQLKGWDGLFPARCFQPVYPHIVEELLKLDAPSPERVLAEA